MGATNTTSENKPLLAVLTSRFPYPLEKGDKLRLYHQLKGLSEYFHIILLAIGEKNIEKYHVDNVREFVHEIHYFRISPLRRFWNLSASLWSGLPFQVAYFYDFRVHEAMKKIVKEKEIPLVYCQLARMAPYCDDMRIPVTLDFMDAFGVGMERRAGVAKGVMKIFYNFESRKMKAYEQQLCQSFQQYTIISEQDKTCFHGISGAEAMVVLPNGIDESFFIKVKSVQNYDLVFVGNMGYLPNIEAAEFLALKILPNLPENTSLLIAGARPHPRVKVLSNKQVTVSGWFDDIRQAYASGKIFVAPLWSGTGQQNKILEAMAQGMPCITTHAVNNAIGGEHMVNILLAKDVSSFCEQVLYLLSNDEAVFNIGKQAQKYVKQNFSWNDKVFQLKNLILSSDFKK